MKILLIHKFHYMLGGTETFHYNLAEALTAAGHEVIFFSMYDERNIPCAQDKYFVSNVDYNDPNLSTFKKIKMGIKLIYSFESKHNIEKLIRDEKPDIAHIGLLHRQITFSVVDVLKKYNIPVVIQIIAPAPIEEVEEREKIDKDTGLAVLNENGEPEMERVEYVVPRFRLQYPDFRNAPF